MPLIARICQALRRLRRTADLSVVCARRRRDDRAAHGRGLFDVRQRRPADQADADRPHPGPLRPDHLQARRSANAAAATRRAAGRTSPSRSWSTRREQVLDPMTAYQITSMMEGVVQRGTATVAQAKSASRSPARPAPPTTRRTPGSSASRPTSSVGVYIGYDKPRNLGKRRDRRPSRRADLQGVHEAGARRQAGGAVPRAGRHQADPRRCARPACAPARATRQAPSSKPSSPAPRRRTITRSSASPTPTGASPQPIAPPDAGRSRCAPEPAGCTELAGVIGLRFAAGPAATSLDSIDGQAAAIHHRRSEIAMRAETNASSTRSSRRSAC